MPFGPLPFGNDSSPVFSNADGISEILSRGITGLRSLSPANPDRFGSKTASCEIGDIRVIAIASPACHLEIEESPGWTLIVPYTSHITCAAEGRNFDLTPGNNALLISNPSRIADRKLGSVVNASFNAERLGRTCAAIAGKAPDDYPLIDPVNELSLRRQPGLFRSFLQLCGMIDEASRHAGLTALLGLDDTIYRWMATALVHPDSLAGDHAESHVPASRIDVLCDMIRTMDERALTLTQMESLTGLSSRSLQYAFKQRFNVSPMEWQRRERLLMARQKLCDLAPDETITSIAYAMGFSSSAAFTTLFKRTFGETPSQALRTAHNR